MSYTKSSQWKRGRVREQKELPLPSGNVVIIRKLQPLDFLSTGILPAGLMDIADDAERAETFKQHIVDEFKSDPDAIIKAMIKGYVVAPQIVDQETDSEDEIPYHFLDEQDRLAIIEAGNDFSGFTQEALADAKNFRIQ